MVKHCCFRLFICSSNKPFWSDNGMTFAEDYEDNYTTCFTDHLTSFAVLINYNDGQSKLQVRNLLANKNWIWKI